MKILLPVEGLKENVDNEVLSFFDASSACIYDTEEQSFVWTTMESISKKPGNFSIELKRKGIRTIICRGLPLLALELFQVSGLTVYKANKSGIASNVGMYHSKLLPLMMSHNADANIECKSSCSSCGSTCT